MVGHPAIWITIGVAVGLILVLSVVPLPNSYNVEVEVQSYEISLILANDFGISSVQGNVQGQATVIDWGILGLGIGPPAISATFVMTVCVIDSSHCASKSASQWFPTVPIINGGKLTATDNFIIGYVPGQCQAPITVQLTQNGADVADGSGTVDIGGGC
jgi:hypothetical protein